MATLTEDKYSRFLNLTLNPFGETPDPRFYFASDTHRRAIEGLLESVREGRGFTLLTGEVGVGKTLIARLLVAALGKSADTAVILYPHCTKTELLRTLCEDLEIDLSAEPDAGHTRLLNRLNDRLLENARIGRQTVVIIDEAQALSDEILETIRLLGNLETEQRKLLNLILVAQPELEVRLRQPRLRQLRQRIARVLSIEPLDARETEQYIRHRLDRAGGGNLIRFENDAVALMHKLSGGLPREINRFCEKLLLASMQAKVRLIRKPMVQNVAREVSGCTESRSWFSTLFSRPRKVRKSFPESIVP